MAEATERPRRAEVIAALSLATDLGVGQPLGQALRACVIAVRLAEAARFGEADLERVYYLSLLRYVGCTADAHEVAVLFGDDIAFNAAVAEVEADLPSAMLPLILRHAGSNLPWPGRLGGIVRTLIAAPTKAVEVARAHCQVGQALADRLGCDLVVQAGLGQVFERWDGRGRPNRMRGEAIDRAVRVIQIARDVEIYHRLGGIAGALAMVRRRAGGWYDPALVERFGEVADSCLSDLDAGSEWDLALAIEPGHQPRLTEAELDAAARAIADFVDLKSPHTVGHSSGVAAIAVEAARWCRLPEAEVSLIGRAALVHDLGQVGVSNAIWDKPGAFRDDDWERVRLHPYYTERILSRPAGLRRVGAIAALHHERLDGSGYHRGEAGPRIPIGARLIAAAEAYQARLEDRPHRSAYSADRAAEEVAAEARAGRLDPEAVAAVLAVAGHRAGPVRRGWPAGLSDREVEVLRLLARGRSNRRIADALSISPSTVDHHIRHIYGKIGVSARAAATLFAMQHDLIDRPDEK